MQCPMPYEFFLKGFSGNNVVVFIVKRLKPLQITKFGFCLFRLIRTIDVIMNSLLQLLLSGSVSIQPKWLRF